MSSYFTLPSFARASKNKAELEKTNPQQPILKDEDEKFLERVTSGDHDGKGSEDVQPETISDEGKVIMAPKGAQEREDVPAEQAILPETQPEQPQRETDPEAKNEQQTDPIESKPTKSKRRSFDLPSQEEAEAATKGFPRDEDPKQAPQAPVRAGETSWKSYLPKLSGRTTANKSAAETEKGEEGSEEKPTWKEYASSYVPSTSSLPSMPNLPSLSWQNNKDAQPSPVYNEDGTIDEAATKEKQQQEVSVLLDNLNASQINNRVFSLSGPMQNYYGRFTECLRDTINGAPTAYDDMDKLMKDAGPHLQKQFESMPPFVQTLVKSLPAKLSTTLGPELLAAASEKPGADAKARLAQASKSSSSAAAVESVAEGSTGSGKKQKKKTPGMKKLISEKGAVTSALSNIVNFIKLRFPFLASATNVLMSLAVFILMLVFWYCHKRGRETRLAKEAEDQEASRVEAEGGGTSTPEEYDESDSDESPEKDVDLDPEQQQASEKVAEDFKNGLQGSDGDAATKQDIVNKADPSAVPLPDDAPK
ncbi:hypothetical protein K431DRAFT_281469 [Polychaeton citri CBS 116435]|uniref:Uncharacterized protein n=1 Tax=Polychaeton citri CBS 116435 TaxID=1314669 RepID=A0A9P4UQX2_9PEZI|nr:hypothetical protein K431DRAFT_281469 [Polychaeton citri CBS 116435]